MDGDTLLLAAHPAQGVEEEVLVAAGHHLVGGIIQQGGGGYPHDIGLSVVVNVGGDRHGQGEGTVHIPFLLVKGGQGPIVDLLGEGGGGGSEKLGHADAVGQVIRHRQPLGNGQQHIVTPIPQGGGDDVRVDGGQQIVGIAEIAVLAAL